MIFLTSKLTSFDNTLSIEDLFDFLVTGGEGMKEKGVQVKNRRTLFSGRLEALSIK